MKTDMKRVVAVLAAVILCYLLPGRSEAGPTDPPAPPRARATARPEMSGTKVPIYFEENRSQADARAKFLSRGKTATLFLDRNGAVVTLHPGGKDAPGAAVRLDMGGANARPCVEGRDPLTGRVSYLRGSDPERWVRSVPTYARVRYEEVYPGIDLVFHGSEGQLEYDFVIKPGADPAAIRLRFEGAETMTLGVGGDLVLGAGGREFVQRAPVAYQTADAGRVPVSSRLVLLGDAFGFELGEFDRSRELVIDPVLGFSTYLGGSELEYATDVAVDGSGNVYVSGVTESVNFPTTPGAFDVVLDGSDDAFVAKLDPSGSFLIYATYLGGSSVEGEAVLEVDSSGNAYLAGRTDSTDFPTTPGAFDRSFAGPSDAFITRLNASGSNLIYSTYLGGSDTEYIRGSALDTAGNLYAVGATNSTDFPTTSGAFDRTYNGGGDAFVTKLNPSGTGLVYSTYLGGPPVGTHSGNDYASDVNLDASGNAFVTGTTYSTKFPTTRGAYDRTLAAEKDPFVSKLNPSGSALVYSTYLGGNEPTTPLSTVELGGKVAVDSSGAAIVAGSTRASDFPTTAGAYDRSYNGGTDIFVTKLNAAGSALVYSTFVGGSGNDDLYATRGGLALDASGAAYLAAGTGSSDFPTTVDALDSILGGPRDAAICKLSSDGSSLVFGSYFGGTLSEEAYRCRYHGSSSSLYVVGQTMSQDYPTHGDPYPLQDTYQGGYSDACVIRLDF